LSIPQSVNYILKNARNSDEAAIKLVRKFWDDLSLSDSDIKTLAQQALASHLSSVMVGKRRPEPESRVERIPARSYTEPIASYTGSISIERPKEETIDIEISVLHASYDINGRRKKFITFTVFDLNYTINRYEQQIEGHRRHLQVMEYAKERLTKLGKKSISELARGEQTILARKLQAAVDGRTAAAA